MDHIAFPHQHFLCFFADLPQQRFTEQLFFKCLLDALIEIERSHSELLRGEIDKVLLQAESGIDRESQRRNGNC